MAVSHESRNELRAIGKQSHAAGIKHKKDKDIKAAPYYKVKKDHLRKKLLDSFKSDLLLFEFQKAILAINKSSRFN